MRKYQFGGPSINLAFQRANTGSGRIARDRLYGNPGKQQIMARIALTNAGGGITSAPFNATTKANIQLDFHENEWDATYNGTTLDTFAASLGCLKPNVLAIQIVEYSSNGIDWNIWSISTFGAGSRNSRDGQKPQWSVSGLPESYQFRVILHVARDMNVGCDGEGD